MNREDKLWIVILIVSAIIFVVTMVSEAAEIVVGASPDVEFEYLTGGEYSSIFENATCDDFEALEQVVFWEAARADCPLEVDIAVVETVCNRVLDPEWPDTIYGVIHDHRWGKQFCYGDYISEHSGQDEMISDAIEYVLENGRTILPSTSYQYFATKKQSLGKNHILVGDPSRKHMYMYFCEGK